MPKSLTGSIVGIQQTFVSSLPLHPTRASIFKKVRARLSEGLTGNVVMGNRKGLKWWAAESPLTHLGAVSKPATLVPEGPPSPLPLQLSPGAGTISRWLRGKLDGPLPTLGADGVLPGPHFRARLCSRRCILWHDIRKALHF